VSRGHRGKRPSIRKGRVLPARSRCPDCGKKGVTQPKATQFGLLRECQYCRASWGEKGWAAAAACEQISAEGRALPLRANDPRSDNSEGGTDAALAASGGAP
jgi:hypothetical protein